MRRSAVDVGSNSILLTVADRKGAHWEPVEELSWVTALGEGTRETGRLADGPMERSLQALRTAFETSTRLEARSTVAAGTMALRIAGNSDDFLNRAHSQGTPVRILSADDEARLGFMSVANDPQFAQHGRVATVDIGGHSTEISLGVRHENQWRFEHRKSYPMGTLSLRGGVLNEESPSIKAILDATKAIDEILEFDLPEGGAGLVVALGAAGTNLVSIRDRLDTWDPFRVHGASLDYEEISRASGWLMRMVDAERARVKGLERGRERTIHIGALILERCLYALRAESCLVSVRGWRYGLLDEPEAL